MRTCIVSKFPPIQGGIASRTYWRVLRALENGHEVAVVTNAGSVEADYRIECCESHLQLLVQEKGLLLRDVPGPVPWHVPNSEAYLDRLLNELLSLLRSGHWDNIESDYLVPYGIAGHLASKILDIPHVVRHGGSDLGKFLDHPGFSVLLREVLASAEQVVTDEANAPALVALGARVTVAPVCAVDQVAFTPEGRAESDAPPVWAYIGKVNHHWQRKGLEDIARWYASQPEGAVTLRLVGQGRGLPAYLAWARSELGLELSFEPFLAPWEMPRLLREVDRVLALSVDDPMRNWSILAAEAEACGCTVVRSVDAIS